MVYVGSYDFNLYALNKTSGSLVWKYYIGTIIFSSPAVADGIVYIGDVATPAKIYAINATTGDLVWRFVTTGGSTFIQSSAAIVDGVLFVGCNNWKVYAIGEFPDVAITDVTTLKTVVGAGYGMSVNVTATNQGNYTETFNVTLYANTTSVALQTITLESNASTTLAFTLDATGLTKGNYTISACASPVVDETDIEDNTFTDGDVKVGTPGNVDGNSIVNMLDLYMVSLNYGKTTPYATPEIANCDIDWNGIINMLDLYIAATHYGQTDP